VDDTVRVDELANVSDLYSVNSPFQCTYIVPQIPT